MLFAERGSLDKNLRLSVLFDDTSLGFAGGEGINLNTETFAGATILADRVKIVLAKTTPASINDSSDKRFAGMLYMTIIHSDALVWKIGTGVVKHAKISRIWMKSGIYFVHRQILSKF